MGGNSVILNNIDLKQHSALVKQSLVLYQCIERKKT